MNELGPLHQSGEPGDRQPLWLMVKTSVLAMIREQQLPENAKLPSETELCSTFGVSRIVVREAMAQLVAARVVYRLQGRGAFVARRNEAQGFVGATRGFSRELLEQNHTVTRKILRQYVGLPGVRAQKLLQLGPRDRIIGLDRVLMVDGTPRITVQTVIPESLAPGLDRMPMEGKSLHATLLRQYGVGLSKAQRWLDATLATPLLGELLQVAVGAPLLEIESCARMEGNRPAEYYLAYYRTDQARLSLDVS